MTASVIWSLIILVASLVACLMALRQLRKADRNLAKSLAILDAAKKLNGEAADLNSEAMRHLSRNTN